MSNQYTPTPYDNNKPITDASLTDILNEHARAINLKLNCHAIGQIQDFNSAKQTCTVTLNYQREFVSRNNDGTYSAKPVPYPTLINVPIVILSGGNANLTFPIKHGDDCLILFNDRDLDTWLTSATVQPPNTPRLHSLSDGIALVGLKHYKKSIAGYDTDKVVLKNGDTYVGISETHLKIANNLTSLKDILDDLISALNTSPLIAVTGSPGGPSPINPAITTKLSALSTKIGNLLE
jgi:hypothetical protein